MKLSIYPTCLFIIMAISGSAQTPNISNNQSKKSTENLPYLTFEKKYLFPGDSMLSRPEDGVALTDGRVIVSDEQKGLRIIEKTGSNRPFGNFSDAGFVTNTTETPSAPNGLFLEHDKQHLLMCDYYTGKIYRINISSEKVVVVYDHPFSVNAIYRDKTGAIWFTQSDNNTNRNVSSINSNIPSGAVYRLANEKSEPTTIVDSLHLANGITMDQDEKTLFVAESLMNRILSFDVDITNGKTSNHGVAAVVVGPDNICVDSQGRLIVASPITSTVTAVDFKNHSQHIIFDASTPETRKLADEWFFRSQTGKPRLDLFTRKLFGPLPGLLTGMFFSPDGRTLYIATLGKAILKLDMN
ncbi:MAG: DUF839 domain-containing protein [Chitinophagaceae bacterium]|nr:MAG: DUF839 domain-containing protein [Chitinophagaceae bacterium]